MTGVGGLFSRVLNLPGWLPSCCMQQRLPQFPAEPAFGFRVQRARCLFAKRNFAASRSLSFGHVAGVGEGSGLCAVRKGPCPSSQRTPRAVLGETRREEVFAATPRKGQGA